MSDNRYRATLNAWAAQHVPDGAKVTNVSMTYDDGWDPTFTDRPESLSVWITYTIDGIQSGTDMSMEQLTSVGELLTALFAIEDRP